MFEFEATGVVTPSYITQTVRLFSPSSGFYVDQFFIVSLFNGFIFNPISIKVVTRSSLVRKVGVQFLGQSNKTQNFQQLAYTICIFARSCAGVTMQKYDSVTRCTF